jgi:hypothetical protein
MLSGLINMEEKTTLLSIDQIKIDGGTQMRAELHEQTVVEYMEEMAPVGWSKFPPVIVYHDGESYWLADGFHRVEAFRRVTAELGLQDTKIPAEVRAGTRRDAILYAASANATHGLRRTNADKRRAVETLLQDEEWRQWSDREIARRCHVSHNFVKEVRRSLSSDYSERRYTTKHGTTTIMNTAMIGTSRTANMDEIKAATWGDKPYAQIWEIQNALRRWQHGLTATELRVLAKSRTGDWFKCQAALGEMRYRSRDLVQALNNLADEMEQERATETDAPNMPVPVQSAEGDRSLTGADPWAAAWNSTQAYQTEERVDRVAKAMLPWVQDWLDDTGRTWRDVADHNPQYAISPFRQAIEAEWRRRKLDPISSALLVKVIRRIFEMMALANKQQQQDVAEQLFQCIKNSATLNREQQRIVLKEMMLGRGKQYHQMLAPWLNIDEIEPGELRVAARRAYMRLLDAQMRSADMEMPVADTPAVVEETLLVDAPLTAADMAVLKPAQQPDTRTAQMSRLINIYSQTIATFDEYSALTGCFVEVLPAKRELEKLIKHLRREISLLNGEIVSEEAFACF